MYIVTTDSFTVINGSYCEGDNQGKYQNHMLNCKKRIILYTWLFDPYCKLNKYTVCEIFKIL